MSARDLCSLVLFVIVAAALTACQRQAALPMPWQYDQLVQDKLTNDVTGYSRTITIDVQQTPDSTNAGQLATATATVEYVNELGGIQRTNLPYLILEITNAAGDQHIIATEDYGLLAERSYQQLQAALHEMSNTPEPNP